VEELQRTPKTGRKSSDREWDLQSINLIGAQKNLAYANPSSFLYSSRIWERKND